MWDERVLEKPERVASSDLGAVRSSKGRRLSRIKPGFYRPPGPPIFVPGRHWVGLLLLGRSGPPTVAALRWWTNRGPRASDQRTRETQLLDQGTQAGGRRVCHVWDRGFAGSPWLRAALTGGVRFVLRWPGRYKLRDAQGRERKAWEIARGQRSWDHRLLWDARHHCERQTGVLALPVRSTEPDLAVQPLWLVIARRGRGQEPWSLLTTEPVHTAEDAWRAVFAYARRWQIERAGRYGKSELAMESPRLWTWERRQKLLLLATVAYAFLLSLLAPALVSLRRWLLRWWCHRTGKRSRATATPLYRLRSALSRLWQAYLPSPLRHSG